MGGDGSEVDGLSFQPKSYLRTFYRACSHFPNLIRRVLLSLLQLKTQHRFVRQVFVLFLQSRCRDMVATLPSTHDDGPAFVFIHFTVCPNKKISACTTFHLLLLKTSLSQRRLNLIGIALASLTIVAIVP